MNATLWLRIASVVSVLFVAGHARGGQKSWLPIGESEVLQTMRSFRFDAMGANRSYLEFYLGFGHLLTVLMVLQAVVLWQMASLARTEAARLRPMIAAFLAAQIASAIVEWRFIFAIPVAFSVVITVCLAVALAAAGRRPALSTRTG
jgi:hypothetical protein